MCQYCNNEAEFADAEMFIREKTVFLSEDNPLFDIDYCPFCGDTL